MSADGGQARDIMLGLMKTCQKLGISVLAYLGVWLGLNRSVGLNQAAGKSALLIPTALSTDLRPIA